MDLEKLLQMELSERRKREATLENIDKGLASLVNESVAQKNNELSTLLNKINELEMHYSKEIQELKFRIQRQESEHEFEKQQMKNNYDLLDQKYRACLTEIEKCRALQKRQKKEIYDLESQILKCKKMIKNQENLIDDFRMSVDQQVNLEKELLKSSFEEKQFKLKAELSKALQSMQASYEQKLKKATNSAKLLDYKRQMKQFKKYFQTNKENAMAIRQPTQKNEKKEKINSQYSTSAMEGRQKNFS